ncbi:hypothetical protein MNBD_PLANCTO03-1390 [hydrothermal vent metagenome]|uniref:Glycosyltransferase n=1 Tax=hydrothermal vent metagenome TaxID=652676 RepID=A0A3B1E8B6_9ZZZZ
MPPKNRATKLMRILHISTRLILGGSQENTVLSCEGQARLGHEVHLAFGPIFGPEGSSLARVEAFNHRCKSDIELATTGDPCTPIGIHTIPNLCRELSPGKDIRAYRELKHLIATLKPDIVHTHSSKAGVLGRAAAWSVLSQSTRTSRAPRASEGESVSSAPPPRSREGLHPAVIHTIHGPPFMPIEGNAARRTKIRTKNHIYTLAERYAARRCHTIIAVADAMTEQFLERRIGTPAQYITIRSGMETEPFLTARPGEHRSEIRHELGLAETDFVIGTVARLAEHKGHDDILDALGDDLRAHPDWKLLWVGDGWWGDRLRARAAGMGLADQLITTGLVPNDRVPAMMRAMDILVHPSYREGLPRTVPQALLAGVTPIAYDTDGTREICRTSETGILVPLADRAALREAVIGMYEKPDERRHLAATGRAECVREFAAERMVHLLEEVYTNAIKHA